MQTNLQVKTVGATGISIVDRLMIEHRLLREQMHQLEDWLDGDVPPGVLRERAALLAITLEGHAQVEEARLFASLGRRSETARALIEPMEIEHERIRELFGEIRRGPEITLKLRRVLDLAERHFAREEEELFPLAAEWDG